MFRGLEALDPDPPDSVVCTISQDVYGSLKILEGDSYGSSEVIPIAHGYDSEPLG